MCVWYYDVYIHTEYISLCVVLLIVVNLYSHRIYLCGGMVEGSEVLRNEFKKSWEIHTHLGFYVSFCGQYYQYNLLE